MLPKQVMSYKQLKGEGLTEQAITILSASLRIFPTPFKGIYYIPSDEERRGWFIERSLRVLTLSLALFLSDRRFYYSCTTAEEASGISWRPSGELHVVNEKKSARINITERVKRNLERKTYRAKKIAHLPSYYENKIILHKVRTVEDAKTKQTPYGTFALTSQIKKDKKRFKEA